MKELLNQNWLGVAIGIIGLLAAYIFYRRSLIRSKISFIRNSLFVIGQHSEFPSELEVFYRGKKVPLVTKSKVIIWNAGNSTISGAQIVETDPLRIELAKGCEVLDVEIERTTRKTNAFHVAVLPECANVIRCHFDYLEPQDGAVIRVIHTASDIVVKGTLRGIPKGLSNLGDSTELPEWVDTFLGVSLTLLAGVLFYAVLYFGGVTINLYTILGIAIFALAVEILLKVYASPRWKTKIPAQLN